MAQVKVDWTKLNFDERMKLRAERRANDPEFQARVEAIKRRRRYRDIWRAIHAREK